MLTGDFLRQSAARYPDKIAVIQDANVLTYRELDALANRFANALLQRELGKGRTIAIIAANLPEYPIVYFGAARAGCVSAHISVRATTGDIAGMLDQIGAGLVLFDADHEATVVAALQQAQRSEQGVVLNAAGSPSLVSLQDLLRESSDAHPSVVIQPDDPLAITFTGGTTGTPKGVVVSHAARFASAQTATENFGIDASDIMGIPTPLFHAAGLFVIFAPAILQGTTTVLLRSWSTGKFIEMVERHGITATFLVPTQLADLIAHPQFSTQRLQTLRKISYAGAPMSPDLLERARIALPNVRFTENYGQSETGPITVRSDLDPPDKQSTVGRRVRTAEVQISNEHGEFVPQGVAGEIVTRGPHVFTGYFNDPGQTAQAFQAGGWLHTGDVGYFDADDYLVLIDRIKDLIICGGENIYPAEIENALYAHEAVSECAAFGVPDERSGELPAAHVVLRAGVTVSADELIEFCATRIPRHKRPRLIRFVPDLPRTAVGKIQRNLVRAPYWQDRARSI